MGAAQPREEECEAAHSAQRALSHTGWAGAFSTALESKGSVSFLHITHALFLLQAEPPANVSAQDRTGEASQKITG